VHRIASASEIAPGTTRRVVVEGQEILICNIDGNFFAIEDVCTHDGGPLDQGDLEGACIVCPRHGATFDVRTGAALTLPAVVPLLTFAIKEEAGDIFLETSPSGI
jgi:3-phenylpropionate/trans-cinnamate dioxygenase ferredoxin subunit